MCGEQALSDIVQITVLYKLGERRVLALEIFTSAYGLLALYIFHWNFSYVLIRMFEFWEGAVGRQHKLGSSMQDHREWCQLGVAGYHSKNEVIFIGRKTSPDYCVHQFM